MSDKPSSEIFIFGFGWEGTVSALDRLDIGDKMAEGGYFLTRIRYKGRVYWRFGRKEPNLKGIPLYYSTTLGKLYVPKVYLDKKYKLVCSVIMYRLRDLRIPYFMKNC